MGHLHRIEPNTQGQVRTIFVDFGNPIHTFQGIDELRRAIVFKKEFIISPIRRQQGEIHDGLFCLLTGRYAIACYFARQGRIGLGHAVLDLDHIHVIIRTEIELDIKGVVPIVITGGTHVDHVVNAVDFFFNCLGNRLLYNLSVGTNVVR